MPIVVSPALVLPDAELEWKFSPSGGPGGQHANKANTRVELQWHAATSAVLNASQRRLIVDRLGDTVRVTVDDERSQTRNREIAERRLAERVAASLVVPKRRRATRPTPGSRRRRVEQKRRTGDKKRLRRPPSRDD